MTAIIFYLFLPLMFCNDSQLIRIWMKDVSSSKLRGVHNESLFLSVELNTPNLTSPDFKYPIYDVIETQLPHKYVRNDDDFQIYGDRHWEQQVFRFFPANGLILSERFPDMALDVVTDYLQLVEKDSVPENRKWNIKESAFDTYKLTHSKFETEHFFIEYFNPNSDLNNNTHVTVDDIQPESPNENTGNTNKPENNLKKIEQKKENNLKIKTNKEENIIENKQPEKKNTKIWIFVSVAIILVIIGVFIKIGCFPNYRLNKSNDLEEKFIKTPSS